MIASKNLQLLAIPGKPSLRQNLEIGATRFYGELRKQRTAKGDESKPNSVRTLWPRSTSRPNWEVRCNDIVIVAGRVKTRDLLVTFKEDFKIDGEKFKGEDFVQAVREAYSRYPVPWRVLTYVEKEVEPTVGKYADEEMS